MKGIFSSCLTSAKYACEAMLVLLLGASLAAAAPIDGTVYNGTTGKPEPRVAVTLVKFDGGMDPVDEVYSGSDGKFVLEKSLTGSSGQPVSGMLRAEFQGVFYSEMLPPGGLTTGLRLTVYSIAEGEILPPRAHVIVLEPGGREMVISESFLFSNEAQPPKTFRDPDRGTLRFYLPSESKGIVQVTTTGPAGMPLRSVATETGEEDVYKVDFPIKPGENRIDLTYLVPHTEGGAFESRVLYEGVTTRIAVPPGVNIEGDDLQPMGQEPHTQAAIYEVSTGPRFTVSVAGEGRLTRAGPTGAESGGGGGQLRVAPAPVAKELPWVLVLAGAILAVGFYRLYNSRIPRDTAPRAKAARRGDAPAEPKPRLSAGASLHSGRRKR